MLLRPEDEGSNHAVLEEDYNDDEGECGGDSNSFPNVDMRSGTKLL